MSERKKVASRPNRIKEQSIWQNFKENKFFYFLVLPGFVFLILFKYIPMAGLYMVFERYTYQGGLFGSEFVGLKNFAFFFKNIGNAMRATRNTIVINVGSIILGMIVSIAIAICLNEIRNQRFRAGTQALMLFPYFISWIALGAISMAFFDAENGILNRLLLALGMKSINWYMQSKYWWAILIIMRTIKTAGYSSLIYYAALLNIDPSLYEAAKIDGANRWKQISNITLPLLKPTIIIMFLLNIGGVLAGGVDEIMGMTQLSPMLLERTDTIATYVYRTAIKNGQFESASAITIYQSVFGFIFVMVSNWIVKKVDPDYSLF